MEIAAAVFGEHVRRARERLNYTQEGLAAIAGMNKETVMRIEQGFDAKVRTIGKLRKVLPGLPDATRNEGTEQPMGTELSDMATRIGHLVHGFISQDRLHRVRAFVLQQLQEEQSELLMPSTLQQMNQSQEQAERRIVERGQKSRKMAKATRRRVKTDGGGQH